MPRGSYTLTGRSEAFSCAPGPAGWRHVGSWPGGSLDLVCDTAFRPVRFALTAGPAWLRGGGLRADDGAPLVEWVVSREPGRVRTAAADAVLTSSPATLLALVRHADARGGPGALGVLVVDEESLAVLVARRTVRRVEERTHPAPDGDLRVTTWHVDDPDTGQRSVVHAAGDVVLAVEGEGAVELADLDGPPWQA